MSFSSLLEDGFPAFFNVWGQDIRRKNTVFGSFTPLIAW